MTRRQLESFFRQVQVVRSPRRRLATFGSSRIDYQLVTEVPGLPDRARLRTGLVMAERPQIITVEAVRDRFQGFGPDARRFADLLVNHYGEAIHGLEYQFKNEPGAARVELSPPDVCVRELARRHDNEGNYDAALIRGADNFWELSVMKFIVEETLASFASNLQDLSNHGFFDTDDDRQKKRHREIQQLIGRARADRSLIPVLAERLKRYDLFETYQDAFFQLVNS